MFKKFGFDYDPKGDSLFLYDQKSRSKASIQINDLILDFNSRKEISGIEILNASVFFKGLSPGRNITKKILEEIQECKVDISQKESFMVIKISLFFRSEKAFSTPVIVPAINRIPPLSSA